MADWVSHRIISSFSPKCQIFPMTTLIPKKHLSLHYEIFLRTEWTLWYLHICPSTAADRVEWTLEEPWCRHAVSWEVISSLYKEWWLKAPCVIHSICVEGLVMWKLSERLEEGRVLRNGGRVAVWHLSGCWAEHNYISHYLYLEHLKQDPNVTKPFRPLKENSYRETHSKPVSGDRLKDIGFSTFYISDVRTEQLSKLNYHSLYLVWISTYRCLHFSSSRAFEPSWWRLMNCETSI